MAGNPIYQRTLKDQPGDILGFLARRQQKLQKDCSEHTVHLISIHFSVLRRLLPVDFFYFFYLRIQPLYKERGYYRCLVLYSGIIYPFWLV